MPVRLVGLKSARKAGRWVRGRLAGGALVLGYHRVAQPLRDPFELCVSPRWFTEHMEVLRRVANPVPLGELAQALANGHVPRGAVAVTFDDGYADVVRHAEPVLRRLEIPATLFIVSGLVGRRPWWDELAHVVFAAPPGADGITLECAGTGGERVRIPLVLNSPGGRAATIRAVHRRMMEIGDARKRDLLDTLRAATRVPDEGVDGDDILDGRTLARLARGGLIEIGSHTVSHAPLAQLADASQSHELRESRSQLQRITGRLPEHVSYPHGSVGATTPTLARQAGYASACSSTPDLVRSGSDPFNLPRFFVPDCDGEHFSRWLQRWVGVVGN